MAKKNAGGLPAGLARAMNVKDSAGGSGSKSKGPEDSGPVTKASGAVPDSDFNLERMAEDETPVQDTDDEDGPSEEGELPDESDDEDADVSTDGDDEQPGDDEPEETDEDPSEGDEQPEETDETPEESEDEPSSNAKQIALLQEQIKLLTHVALKGGNQVPTPQAPPTPTEDEVPDQILRAVLFGGPESVDWTKLPSGLRDKVTPIAERYLKSEILAARNPTARYQQIQSLVAQDVFTLIEPLLSDYHNRNADSIKAKHLDPLKDPKLRKRAEAIYRDLPGSRASTWADREKTMRAAVATAKAEAFDKKASDQKQKTSAGKAQQKAAGGGKLRGSSPTSGRAGPGKTTTFPDMKKGESVVAYAKRIGKLITPE
jgi:hypothetical protein